MDSVTGRERTLTPDDQAILLAVAKDGLEAAVLGRSVEPVPGEGVGTLGEPLACFVTLHEDGRLRGCVGMLEPVDTLTNNTRDMARSAALHDPRFPAVAPEELPRIDLSVSVLSPPRPLGAPEDFEVGRDGLIVSRGERRGVLLPQVAAERNWDLPTFLSQTCVKAGLPPNAWQDPDTRVEAFSAAVYRRS